MISTVLIIGGGQAGAQAIDTLRREGFAGRLVLIGGEDELPYQRPPLSKKYLSREMAGDRLLFRHRAFYDEHRIDLKLGMQAVRLDAAARRVELADGEVLSYDRLLLCLGADSRRLTCPGAALPGVHYLRSLADVTPIQTGFRPHARVLIIGGGYIGLETAATCRKMGCEVTVLEMADRIMNRVVAPSVSKYFAMRPTWWSSVSAPSRRPASRARPGSPATTASWSMNIAEPATRQFMRPATAPIIRRCTMAAECASNPWIMPLSRRRPRRSICSAGPRRMIECRGSGRTSSTINC
jgi:NADH dehydrogenase FAD-containing subunit